MRNGFLAFGLCALAALTLASGQKHKPKPKRLGPQVIILNVIDRTGATGEESVTRSLFARAGLLIVFKQKKINSISPAEVQGTIDQLQIDYTKTDNWTADNLEKLADPWNAEYIAGATLDSIDQSQPPKKDSRITAHAAVTLWLYSMKDHKFLAEHEPTQTTYMSMKGEEHTDVESTEYKTIELAAETAMKNALKK